MPEYQMSHASTKAIAALQSASGLLLPQQRTNFAASPMTTAFVWPGRASQGRML
jgi:hypothetical protein